MWLRTQVFTNQNELLVKESANEGIHLSYTQDVSETEKKKVIPPVAAALFSPAIVSPGWNSHLEEKPPLCTQKSAEENQRLLLCNNYVFLFSNVLHGASFASFLLFFPFHDLKLLMKEIGWLCKTRCRFKITSPRRVFSILPFTSLAKSASSSTSRWAVIIGVLSG